MGIRDQEIKRLEQYAKGLGLRVEYKVGKRGSGVGAEIVYHDGVASHITLYTYSRISKKRLILNFLHELGHHLSWIYKNRKDNTMLLEALYADAMLKKGEQLPKHQRKLIYLMEKEDAEYRNNIAHEVGITLPENTLKVDIALDIWIYKYYYLYGKYPSQAMITTQLAKIRGNLAKKER